MKMFQNIDSSTSRSSEDLWTEVCSYLPIADQQEDSSDAFSDSFMGFCVERECQSYLSTERQHEKQDGAFQNCIKPWAPLKDSEMYLASLERKLRKIKGISQEVTSKDMLYTLAQAKKECWHRLLQETSEPEVYVEGQECDESTLEHFKRWLQPDKVAISTEEMQCLIPQELSTERLETEEESAAAEQ
ncbi:coiled-coil domain-containing protein 32 [Microcaecilia unicolor]|uniref:Coiled-coil domain-containing protein 32 n=1 Tax=Microcaecilia unicolor TaxID=1415580 RepID=A0A6P7YUP6_9AMPH|nr:coiled-coil domain-containing protein 32 [Microcaecilia unicolor]XP_030070898.1 coiled-coil domain-containing protein 32 [Microcaecilia unicolor]